MQFENIQDKDWICASAFAPAGMITLVRFLLPLNMEEKLMALAQFHADKSTVVNA